MGLAGDWGVRIWSLMTPLTVTRTLRGPARSLKMSRDVHYYPQLNIPDLCSQSHTPCQVPRVTRPSQMGRVRLDPRRQALAWAGMSSGPSQLCFHGMDSGTSLDTHYPHTDHISLQKSCLLSIISMSSLTSGSQFSLMVRLALV